MSYRKIEMIPVSIPRTNYTLTTRQSTWRIASSASALAGDNFFSNSRNRLQVLNRDVRASHVTSKRWAHGSSLSELDRLSPPLPTTSAPIFSLRREGSCTIQAEVRNTLNSTDVSVANGRYKSPSV